MEAWGKLISFACSMKTDISLKISKMNVYKTSFLRFYGWMGLTCLILFSACQKSIPETVIEDEMSLLAEATDLLEHKEYLEKYEKALSSLSEVQRVAFLLNRVEGKSHAEIAEMLNISLRATRKRIYSAVENLRKKIDGI